MRKASLLVVCIMNACLMLGQYSEAGVQVGLSNYIGELSEHKLSSEGYGAMIGVLGRYNFTEYFSAKASLSKGTISGSDEFAKSLENRERNLNFRADVLELALTGELNFSPYNIRANQTGVPYFFMGIAFAHFNPQAQMRGKWYDLQPLKTEGKKYSRYTVAIPFGLGMKFNISYKMNFGFEFGARKTFTDYLDDVSTQYIDVDEIQQSEPTVASLAYRTPELTGTFDTNPVGTERGDPSNNDWYFFGAITFTVNMTDKYGLDFDEKYDIFKSHLKKPKKEKALPENPVDKSTSEKSKKAKNSKDKKFKLFKKKSFLKPFVKKRIDY